MRWRVFLQRRNGFAFVAPDSSIDEVIFPSSQMVNGVAFDHAGDVRWFLAGSVYMHLPPDNSALSKGDVPDMHSSLHPIRARGGWRRWYPAPGRLTVALNRRATLARLRQNCVVAPH